ncbi:von Willebrand factor type A domain protein [Polystyrenella longa]|uniref:von Willebrand factor type A domain protein n=1 Tax=Polystyrenella longa TaxID=2528007 RepID=A0A518CNH9_9PLAN|nr:VWA domain-containing protein [Polystyrenella longa]QDU80780.1 von Willebrand factor type A domain protein [Polystyrenella longa]
MIQLPSINSYYIEHPERLLGMALLAALVLIGMARMVWWRRWINHRWYKASNLFISRSSGRRQLLIISCQGLGVLLVAAAYLDVRLSTGLNQVIQTNGQTVFLLDRSRSMEGEDLGSSRTEAATYLIENLLDSSAGSPVALVGFAGNARVETPLTRDYESVLNHLHTTSDSQLIEGSLISEAVRLAVDCFAARFAGPKRLIVLTDGEFGPHESVVPPRLPTDTDVIILGLGNMKEGARIPVIEGDRTGYLKHADQVVWTRMNPQRLQSLADSMGGEFLPIRTEIALDNAIETISKRFDTKESLQKIPHSLPVYTPLLLVVLFLLLLENLLPLSLFKNTNESDRIVKNNKVFTLLILFSALVSIGADQVFNEEADSYSQYELSKLFNKGVAAYQREEWDSSSELFTTVQSHAKGQLRTQAAYNLANTLYQQVIQSGLSRQTSLSKLSQAIEIYRENIHRNVRIEDSRLNLELAYELKKQIENQASNSPSSQRNNEKPPTPARDDQSNDDPNRDNQTDSRDNNSPYTNSSQSKKPDSGSSHRDSQNQSLRGSNQGRPLPNQTSSGNSPAPLTNEEAERELETARQNATHRIGSSTAVPSQQPPLFPW